MIQTIRLKIYKMLKWSEKHTETDMIYLAKGGFWLMFGQGGAFVFSLLLSWVFANFISKDEYGLYKFVISVFSLLSITTLMGMSSSLVRSVSIGKSGTVYNIIKKRIKFGLMGSVFSIFLSIYYILNNNLELFIIFSFLSILIPFGETFSDYQRYLQGQKNFKKQSAFSLLQRCLVSTFTILSIFLFNNIIYIIIIYLTSFTFFNYLFYKKSLKIHKPNPEIDETAIKYGIHLSVMGTLRMISNHFDKIILFYFLGPTLLATYHFALALPQEIISLFSQINNIALPKFSEKQLNDIKKPLMKKIFKFIILLLIPSLIYIIMAPTIFNIIFPQYIDAIFYSQIFAINIVLIPFGLINQLLTAHSKTKLLYLTNFIEPTIFILLLVILLPIFGILGSIIAITIKNFLHSSILFTVLIKLR